MLAYQFYCYQRDPVEKHKCGNECEGEFFSNFYEIFENLQKKI